MLPVVCAACGWASRRKPGNVVWCPKCGAPAAFQTEDEWRETRGKILAELFASDADTIMLDT